MCSQLKVDERGYELKTHGTADFPITASYTRISRYDGRRFCYHWHNEPEFTVIVSGSMDYQVNDGIFHLIEGQGILVNSNMLHSAWNLTGDCEYLPVNFDPGLVFGPDSNRIWRKYALPLFDSPALPCLVFDPKSGDGEGRVIELFREIGELCISRPAKYELCVMERLYEAMRLMLQKADAEVSGVGGVHMMKQVARIKSVIDHVEAHYREQMTLDTLASVCDLSHSEFCRCFKSVMRQTPTEYVNRVRIRKSLPMLLSEKYTVTEIADRCGFSGSSYFAELFKRYMLCTPKEYVKKARASQ